jgi:DNA-binding winged helix-turn-helix (wHTH) protein/TolB-like protein/lipopolysaccharide biosynthesis regulator YciM
VGNIIYYDFDDFRLDVINEQLLKNNQPIQLTHKAFRTLLILVQNHGQLVKKEDIISKIWHDSFVEDSNLTQHIYILRKTLGNNNQGKPFIETIPKRGYCFIGEIQKVASREPIVEPAIALKSSNEDAVLDEQFIYIRGEDGQIHLSGNSHKSDSPNQNLQVLASPLKSWFFKNRILLLICFAAIIGITFSLYRSFQPIKNPGINSIAVLPFKPIGKDSSDEKLGFGLADAVITSLSKQQKLPVRPASAVFQFTDKNFNSIEAGKELSVDSVLEGTIQREGEWIRVSVKLIKISDGSTIWAENFDEKFTYIFAVQDSISTKVAKSLMLNLSNVQEQQLITRNTSNAEAYLAYQNGRYFWNKRTKEDLEKAVNYFQKAVELDKNYAIAYAMLSDSYNMIHYYSFTDKSKETLDKADEAAQKALSLDESIPEPHIAMSYIQITKYKNNDASVKELERAIQLSPYNPTARIRYGWQLLRLGNMDGAFEQMRIAQENDPLSPVSNSALCSILLLKKNYIEALKYSEKAVELNPNAPVVKVQLGSVYYLNGKIDQAIAILKSEVNNPHSKYDAMASLAYIYAKIGKTVESEEIYNQLKNEIETSKRPSDLVLIAFTLGKKEESLNYFKEMLRRTPQMTLSMISDPYWEELFKDKEFSEVIAQHRAKS